MSSHIFHIIATTKPCYLHHYCLAKINASTAEHLSMPAPILLNAANLSHCCHASHVLALDQNRSDALGGACISLKRNNFFRLPEAGPELLKGIVFLTYVASTPDSSGRANASVFDRLG